MTRRPTESARLPPAGIVGLDPKWSRLVSTPDIDKVGRTWHILDSWAEKTSATLPTLTLLCVHGNPSWSFLWRDVLRQVDQAVGDQVRVIAVDQLDMGFSERTGKKRILATRVDDLCHLTSTLGICGPVITVAHDWGGPVSLGWALRHLQITEGDIDDLRVSDSAVLAGVILTNTAVHQPAGSPAPAVIRLTRTPGVLKASTVTTSAFIKGAIQMSQPKPEQDVRAGFHAPYRHRSRRTAIADFVADIPLEAQHESAAALDGIADGLNRLAHIPFLLLWGPRDKVFSDLYLHDLEKRLPHADVHRFPGAAHFVTEDADVADAVVAWIQPIVQSLDTPEDERSHEAIPLAINQQSGTRALTDFSNADPATDAVVEIAPAHRAISYGEFAERVELLAAGMASFGIHPGERVAVMVTPGIDLCLVVYGCWRLGATLVLVDSGLGRYGMQQALLSADPAWLIGIDKALLAARVLRWPGQRISVRPRSAAAIRTLSIVTDLESLTELGKGQPAPSYPTRDTIAVVAFTSGSTGPSKGVVYRHHQIQAQRDALMSLYQIVPDDRLVAAFAPFALYGPTMGITSIVPDMDVTAPGTLDARSLADALELVTGTLVFASPAALVNVVATRTALTPSQQAACAAVRLVISAGAPVRAELLNAATAVFNEADMHTPYGMTEVLPVADISLHELQQIASENRTNSSDGDGVCVGFPLPGVNVLIDPVDRHGNPTGDTSTTPNVLGEIIVKARHARDGYDRLWLTDHQASSQPPGWHRTGDIGQLDSTGRLWVGGRLGHIITPPEGALAPVDSEQRIETLNEIEMAALVGVGPIGTQVLVSVVQMPDSSHPVGGASLTLTDRVRDVVADEVDIAAVLVVRKLPVDRRHNSKVDRSAVAIWAASMLAGERVTSL